MKTSYVVPGKVVYVWGHLFTRTRVRDIAA